MSTFTSFGKLKQVIVGNETNFEKRISDFSFKYFYQEALKQNIYDKSLDYYVTHDLCQLRNEQLDNLAKLLEDQNIKVHRPELLTKLVDFKTPEFKSELSPASNVRDITFIYGNKIIETPVFVRNRYFENKLLYNIFNDLFLNNKYQWIRFPHIELTEKTMDLDDWYKSRDYNTFNKNKYVMAIDGAQFLRIGKDVIVNINSYNHFLGLEWIKSFFPDTNFHIINIADNHIDGALICLKPGTFLVNPNYPNIKDLLPQKFKNWNFLYPKITERKLDQNINNLASTMGMDINLLSISPTTVISNKKAIHVNNILDKNGFNVLESELDHCELFGGGIHCSTLDVEREDEYIEY